MVGVVPRVGYAILKDGGVDDWEVVVVVVVDTCIPWRVDVKLKQSVFKCKPQ